MVPKIIHFFKYNNAFTLAILFVFFSTGTIFAANDDLRASVITSEDKIVAVDNSYILGINLGKYKPDIEIVEINEDDDSYFVVYRMNNIEIVDGVWALVSNENKLTVNKTLLGDRDLGLYVAEELDEVISAQIAFLKEVQQFEKNVGRKERAVRTKYAGLIGRAFDSKTASFKGYKPVIPETKKPIAFDREAQVDQLVADKLARQVAQKELAVANTNIGTDTLPADKIESDSEPVPDKTDNSDSSTKTTTTTSGTAVGGSSTPTSTATSTPSPTVGGSSTTTKASTTSGTNIDTIPPVITLVGSTNMVLGVGQNYTEPGVSAVDNVDDDISVSVVVVGTVDTDNAGTYVISYTAVDSEGNESSVSRTVVVEAMNDTVPPNITLNGSSKVTLTEGDTYVEEGASATDEVDGVLTDKIIKSGTVDTATAGSYTLTYTVKDEAGNASKITRTIVVDSLVEEEVPPESEV